MRILNLVHDEKFIDGLISEYDFFKLNVQFVVLETNLNAIPFKYIKKKERVKKLVVGSDEYIRLLQGEDFDVVWVHYRDGLKMDFVNRVKKNAPNIVVVWSSWGADLYGLFELPLLRARTFVASIKQSSLRANCSKIFRLILSNLKLNFLFWDTQTRVFLKNVNAVSTILKEEWGYLRQVVSNDSVFFPFAYSTLPRILTVWPRVDLSSKRIWLGNSATYTNNHFDIFPILQHLSEYTVISPLSYGGEREIIDQAGRKFLGTRWLPIKEMMPYKDYVVQLSSCAAFVFAHRRQQALGNVTIALKMGGCVFLDSRNPIFSFLKKHGLVIYTLKDLKYRFNACVEDCKAYQETNREKILALFSENEVISKLQKAFSTVQQMVEENKLNV